MKKLEMVPKLRTFQAQVPEAELEFLQKQDAGWVARVARIHMDTADPLTQEERKFLDDVGGYRNLLHKTMKEDS